ncbi:hypothetical protein H0H92_010192 [Tricholoma furcatifolium]|nr:hypothetical protein H0H92_010192 [Tricholoma furcatifolium]
MIVMDGLQVSTPSTSISGFSTPDVQNAGPQLSQTSRQMLDLVNRLHSTGVQVDIDLPQIAVIGSQSAGKSSLIEAISGVTLPRAAGTCTRCPTECRLSQSTASWKCIVELRIMEDGKLSSTKFGDPITSKEDVEDRIRRAQWAILNPTLRKAHGARHFLTGNDHGDVLEESFSNSYVSLQISGPDVPDLSFVDLPGLIAGVGMTGNSSDIELVKNLVATYIKRESCIILLTVACESRIFKTKGRKKWQSSTIPWENAQSVRIISFRCENEAKLMLWALGVLTKPDRIPTSEEPNWVSIIKNEKEPLENGWYCVKQPSSQQISNGMTWAQARKSEDEFFASTAVWSELDPIYQKYLRTNNLVDRLSSILSDLISKRLPEIQEEIDRSVANTREAIRNLPKPPSSDPRSEISTLIHNFVRDLAQHVAGTPTDGLLQAIRPEHESFRRSIRATAPDFQPFERRYRNKKKIGRAEFLVDEEGHEDEKIIDAYDSGLWCSAEEQDSNIVPNPDAIYIDEVLQTANQYVVFPIMMSGAAYYSYFRARTRELPGNYPFVVQKSYIEAIIKKWHEPAKFLCRFVFQTLQRDVQRLIQIHFGNFGQGQLAQRIKLLFQDHLSKCLERAQERIDWLVKLEEKYPFTLNTHYLTDYKEKFLAHFRSAREKDRNPKLMNAIKEYSPTPSSVVYLARGASPPAPSWIAKVLASLVEMGITVKPGALAKLIEPDGMDPALLIMADVRAYFQVAYKRFADNIPLAIDYELIWGAERDLLGALNTGLGIYGENGDRICREFAQEKASIAGRRDELTKKLNRMQAAAAQLLHIGE